MWTATSPSPPPMQHVAAISSHGSISPTSGEPANELSSTKWSDSLPDAPTVDMRDPVSVDVAFARQRVKRTLLPLRDAIVNERRALVSQRFEKGELERQDRQRLRTLEWKLNLIDDAVLGPELDEQARFLKLKSELAEQLDRFVKDMQRVRPMATRPRRKRRGG